jgi:hypothetical protein
MSMPQHRPQNQSTYLSCGQRQCSFPKPLIGGLGVYPLEAGPLTYVHCFAVSRSGVTPVVNPTFQIVRIKRRELDVT